jgi:hypothetical protein
MPYGIIGAIQFKVAKEHMMKLFKSLPISVALLASAGLSAFDNTQNNGFWDTTKYVNPAPAVSGAAMELEFASLVFDRRDCAMAKDSVLDSRCFSAVGPIALECQFRSIPPGLFFIVR